MKKLLLLTFAAGMVVPSVLDAGVAVNPYGLVVLNASYNTRTVADIPVTAAMIAGGEPNFVMTARQTRVGLDIKSDTRFTPSGAIEVDFWGLRGSGNNGGPTQTAPRLRRAFVELHFGGADLLFGQEWSVFAPLSPTSLMHVALPGLMSSGNLWARLPQIRGTFSAGAVSRGKVKLELALTRPFAADMPMMPVAQTDQFGLGELYGTPWFQGRLGYEMQSAAEIGIGGSVHYGLQDLLYDDPAGDAVTATSFAVAGDLRLGTGALTVSGEAYLAKNIPTLFSNATFSIVRDSMSVDGSREPFWNVEEIEATGGWGEIRLAATERIDIAGSAGLETLEEEFLEIGDLKRNFTVMGTIICEATEGFLCGIEIGYIKTTWVGDESDFVKADSESEEEDFERKSLNLNLSAMLKF